jgi:peroxiredoxin
MRTHKIIPFLFAILLLVTLHSSGLAKQAQQPTPSPSPKSETQLTSLPESVLSAPLQSARGGSFQLSDYSGKVLVLNLWATWCIPCRLQLKSLSQLQQGFKSSDVEVFALSTENPKESAEAMSEFIEDFGLSFKVGWTTTEVATALMQGRDAIPQIYVISRSGRIVKRFIGFNQNLTQRELKHAVKKGLEEKPRAASSNQ